MSRLTIKNSDGTYSQPTHTTFEKMFYKLAFLEDLMEKYHCNDIVDIENMLQENTELKKKLEVAEKQGRIKELEENVDLFQIYSDKVNKYVEVQYFVNIIKERLKGLKGE